MRGAGGFSLVEVIVSMLVMSILGLAVVATVSSVARASTESTNRITATTRAQNLADRLSKSLRAAHLMPDAVPASAFTYADARHVTFYTDEGDASGPRLVDVTVAGTGTTAQESMTQVTRVPTAVGVYPSTGTTQTIAPNDLDLSGAAPVFAYYSADSAVAMTGVLSDVQRASISRIGLTITVHEPGPGVATTVSSSVYLRNMEYR